MPHWRLIIDPPADGVRNMAVDEALLESAATGGPATLRIYRWSEPTLSLGYFQAYADRQQHTASLRCPCVRRRSGGGAIVHDQEVTYSLALPAEAVPPGGPETCYRAAHEAIIDLLVAAMPGARDRTCLCEQPIQRPAHAEPFLCFQRRAAGDLLVVDGDTDHKIAGSAQRKRRGAVLQHGSLLLARSSAAPELDGVAELLGGAELLGQAIEPQVCAERLASRIAARLAADAQEETLTHAEQRFAQSASEKFASSVWMEKR